MEGLPVRQWRKVPAVVNTASPRENSTAINTRNIGWKELPMPRGSELYSPMSQALLRAARMGQVNRPQLPQLEDDKDLGEEDDAEGEADTGYLAMKWSQVPKESEEPEMEFLAKRRKGLPSVYDGITGPLGLMGQIRKVKIRKVDAEGNGYVWDVLVPEGTVVEGEVVEGDELMTEAPAPGTVVDGVGVANAEGVVIAGDQVMPTPPRRRPPPPKRKAKGPARGRKRRHMPPTGGTVANGAASSSSVGMDGMLGILEGAKPTEDTVDGLGNEDADMGDDSVIQDGDDGSEDDEDEGDEGEDGDREEGELSPTPDFDAPGSVSGSPIKVPVLAMIEPVSPLDPSNPNLLDVTPSPDNREPSSSPDLPLAAGQTQNVSISANETAIISDMPTVSSFLSPQTSADDAAVLGSAFTPKTALVSVTETLPEPFLSIAPAPVLEPPKGPLIPLESRLEPVYLSEQLDIEPSAVLSSVAAELPQSHNPQNGSGAPAASTTGELKRFPDGQEDLLGSLERHLNEES
ncbi:hypothetical protein MMC19_006059 [Ptychographa xylographoides]|nr:hypothetical protein [Ptychographa xylographoides]